MLRTLTTLALSVCLLAGAQAQTTPTATSKKAAAQADRTAKKAQRTAKKADKQADRVARKAAAKSAAALNDGWPPLDESTTMVASTTPTDASYGASQSPYGRDNVYAAPGMPVNIRTSKKAVPYSVRPPRPASHSQTTLANGQ
ncbi:hypothetical protein [uncultured Hymenobacter sp.]|uniref:hypothetical protein n=1 Tax=uncultured Hymenobacter sp. TaxID=170016 RepID=UPI0035CA88E7